MIRYTNTVAVIIFFFETQKRNSDFENFTEEREGKVTD